MDNAVTTPKSQSLDPKFIHTFDEFIPQKFSLPPSLIYCMLTLANPQCLQALFESCKHLFLLRPTPICYGIKLGRKVEVKTQTLTLLPRKLYPQMKKLVIANSVTIVSLKNPKILSSLCSRVAKCDARIFNIKNQTLSWKEFEFFVNPQRVEIFHFKESSITKCDGEFATVAEVMTRLPNARKIS